jgi:DNA repair protein RecN (Recombination protein N)
MLTRLRVDSFALIDHIDIELGAGLTVITGETGAGKSILIGALNSILGAPISADLVRGGATRCQVEGLFELGDDTAARQRLELAGFELDDEDHLILRREIRAEGRSRAFVNGAMVPVRRLREAGELLVDLHGQHEHQSLLDPERHSLFLDECGGLVRQSASTAAAHGRWMEAAAGLSQLQGERQRLRDEEELRRYQLEEIRRLAPEAGEDERLEREIAVLANQENLQRTTAGLYGSLYGDDDSIVDRLGHTRRELEGLVEFDPKLAQRVEALEGLMIGVEDVAGGLRDYAEGLQADPERLEAARERLEELRRLVRRHGGDVATILERAAQLEALDERSDHLDDEIAAATKRADSAAGTFRKACAALSRGRSRASRELARSVVDGLAELGMSAAEFRAELTARPDPDAGGAESVEFYVSANRGERALPLARVASGGELSRLMLVLKQIIAERDAVSTLVFDEVDSGISGRVAAAVGRRLSTLAASRQTLVITHLPQIASLADHHFSVRKVEREERTVTEVLRLEGDARAEEIASLLAGDTVSDAARRHAQEMLK